MTLGMSPEEMRARITKSTRHLIAAGGMSNFSFPKLTAEVGFSAPTIYEQYKNKAALLNSCWLEIDREIGDLVGDILGQRAFPTEADPVLVEQYCRLMWQGYWDYLTADAERTLFYWYFYNSEYYTAEVDGLRHDNYRKMTAFVQAIRRSYHLEDQQVIHILMVNLVEGTMSAAVKVLKGQYENTPASVYTIYRMVFQPVYSMLKIQA